MDVVNNDCRLFLVVTSHRNIISISNTLVILAVQSILISWKQEQGREYVLGCGILS